MALTGWTANTNYLFRNSSIMPQTIGFYVSIWCYSATGLASDRAIFGLHGPDFSAIYATTDDSVVLQCPADIISTVSGHPNAAWFHVGGLFMTANQKLYLNAVTPVAATASDAGVNLTSTKVGVFGDSNVNAWANAGALAELSVWDTSGMSVANIDALDAKLYNGGAAGAGGNPLNIDAEAAQPWTGKGVAYLVDSANSLTDLFGNGHNLTMQGTLTNFGSHPTIEAVSGGGTTPLVGAASLTGIASRMNLGMTPRSMVKIA